MSMQFQAQVKSTPASTSGFTPVRTSLLQRKYSCGNHTAAGREFAKKKQILRSASLSPRGKGMEGGEVPPIVHEVIRSPGQPLDPDARAFMELRFRHDFGHVRIHTDERAGDSAQAVNALAYTAGSHLVFGAGKYSPSIASGRRLLAHELAHSVQQGLTPNPLPQLVADPHTALESQADEAADGVIKNVSLPTTGNTISTASGVQTTLLQREEVLIPELNLPPEKEETTIRSYSSQHLGCPDGFTPKHRATWLHCKESRGTKFPACSFCNEGEQEKHCEKILDLLGNHRVIAPIAGKCGDKFEITTPEPTKPPIEVVKAEIPGGDTELDINIDVIRELGLDVKKGRYDVCLKGPIGHDDRLVPTGGSACQKPKSKQPGKRR